jgi:hypothetical protein
MFKLPMKVLAFYPPIRGMDASTFNTFRIGLKPSRTFKRGETVLLVDNKEGIAFGRAKVIGIHTGQLACLAREYGHQNHNQLHDPLNAHYAIVVALTKRYGPHKVNATRKFTVIELRRLKT